MRSWLAAGALALVATGCASSDREGASGPAPTNAAAAVAGDDDRVIATAICEPMWAWITGVGDRFNETSRELKDLPEGDARRDAVLTMLDDIEASGADLLVTLDALAGPITEELVAEVAAGMEGSIAELADIRQLVIDTPELDTGGPQLRLSQVIVRIEKVIDLPKPSLAAYEDPELAAAFVAVPACQHAVKDANDGSPRYNG